MPSSDPHFGSDAPARIVVLDDNQITRLLVRRLLEVNLNCHVTLHATATELLAVPEPPDLYLLDIVLHEECGLDVCRQLKLDPVRRDAPVIFFSEHALPQTRLDSLRVGGVDYIDKPFYPSEFVQRVRGALERSRRQRELEARTAEQHALLRVLCHDLRNSVGSAHALLTHFGPDSGAGDIAPYHELARQAAHSALELIAHVAEYRSLLDEARPLRLERVPAADAIAESVRLLEPSARQKGITLEIAVEPTLALRVNRVVLVHNILNNLLSNAIKFSHAGALVRVEGELVDVPGDADQPSRRLARLRVRDTGIGMPANLIALLDHPGPVPSRPGTAREPGSGLGLQLVRLYVARCEGSMHIESSPSAPGTPGGTVVHLEFSPDASDSP